MAYDKGCFALLKKDRDDARRAAAFDEAYPQLSAPEQAYCDRALGLLHSRGLGEQQAKSILICTILFMHMKVDEQDKWREHGEYIRAAFEWTFAGKLAREVEESV